jgi:hypothetical protein
MGWYHKHTETIQCFAKRHVRACIEMCPDDVTTKSLLPSNRPLWSSSKGTDFLRFSLILELAHTHRNYHTKGWVETTSRPSVESPSSLTPCCSRAVRSHGNPRGRVQSNSTKEDAPQTEHSPNSYRTRYINFADQHAKSKYTGIFPNETAICLTDLFDTSRERSLLTYKVRNIWTLTHTEPAR